MLHASLQGKISVNAGHDEDGHVARFNEDSLTSTVFGLMSFLPGEVAWDLLCQVVPELPRYRIGHLRTIEFWPAWLPQGSNKTRTEPDAYLRFAMGDPELIIDIIVEAKRNPNALQNVTQWHEQLTAYEKTILSYETDKPDQIIYLAVSGLAAGRESLMSQFRAFPETSFPAEIVMCDWTDFSNAARRIEAQLKPNVAHVLSMIRKGLAHAGFVERLSLKNLPRATNLNFSSLQIPMLKCPT